MTSPPPKSILIVGSGVFGLTTAHALSQRSAYQNTTIIILDRSPFPVHDGSSIDTSRIIRADYSDAAYSSLAASAQSQWRQTSPSGLGGESRYSESGLVLVADAGHQGERYVRDSFGNVSTMMKETGDSDAVQELTSRKEIEAMVGTGGGAGDWGYINRRSGWADAEASMRWLHERVQANGRVEFAYGEVTSLLRDGKRVHGVKLKDGSEMKAELVVLATGAWTGALVDLRGRATATGQVLAYLDITQEEQDRLSKMPVLLNMSTGLFIIPPRDRVLKVARHGYGYSNMLRIPNPDGEVDTIEVSLPRTKRDDPRQWIPAEGERACRQALAEMVPWLADRPFVQTRICWYTDTPTGDFLIAYHPHFEGLFLATGGSGHGFKFLPCIGDKIADCIQGRCPVEFREKWAWPKERVDSVVTEDGSRGGLPGLLLTTEMGEAPGVENGCHS
ncbi:MAG: hypothetical protein M1818_005187 [Claussenomyces sp. TS43310]|nr:MAG: hypothetical protein M1818_005187 [Claussenomyces sp. TS43310]